MLFRSVGNYTTHPVYGRQFQISSYTEKMPEDALAMEQLKKMDDVAYVRFASVYRQFSDVNTFMDELKDMLDSRAKNGGMQG